ncbi:MAG: HypC/HybG/HupF family hydrogenase formation chaperone [Varibaculum sp.]|nr:HypC/HybG/HupF family hydrogenase formation chaperone [Varibaculum sp.]
MADYHFPLTPDCVPDIELTDSKYVCVTCSDEGRPLEIVGLAEDDVTARARGERGLETVDVTLVLPVSVGDRVLVHAGTAIARL